VNFVIPKAADLLGPCDLVCDLTWDTTESDFQAERSFTSSNAPTVVNSDGSTASYTLQGHGDYEVAEFVENVGYAMIDRITFAIGSNDIETITGDQLNIINELMKSDEQRLGPQMILKTGDEGAKSMFYRKDVQLAGVGGGQNPQYIETATGLEMKMGGKGFFEQEALGGHAFRRFGKKVTAIAVTSGGSYTEAPTVTLVGGGGYGATATAVMDGTAIASFTITNGGYEYTSAPTVDLSEGGTVTTDAVAGAVTLEEIGTSAYISANDSAVGTSRLMYGCFSDLNSSVTGSSSFATAAKSFPVNFAKKRLIVPIGLFFTKHPSQYFPLCAIAGCNDVRISIKFKMAAELTRIIDGKRTGVKMTPSLTVPRLKFGESSVKLRCHYVHVTGPEASALMNKEHVRLLKCWGHNTHIAKSPTASPKVPIDLSFLHPVTALIITVRQNDEVDSTDKDKQTKGNFQYHGSGKAPIGSDPAKYALLDYIKLNINGQERHPSLAANGIDREYLMNRIMPLMFSNTSTQYEDVYGPLVSTTTLPSSSNIIRAAARRLSGLNDRREIYAFPFALNPEGVNPSGAVNFSKVSHAKLELGWNTELSSDTGDLRVDVYAIYYNWLQVKDGRGILSFA